MNSFESEHGEVEMIMVMYHTADQRQINMHQVVLPGEPVQVYPGPLLVISFFCLHLQNVQPVVDDSALLRLSRYKY